MSLYQLNNNFPMELIDISFVFAAIPLLSHPDALAPIVSFAPHNLSNKNAGNVIVIAQCSGGYIFYVKEES